MKPLAKVWTWIGQTFLPLAIAWAVYVRGGLDGPHLEEGVLISRAYWGLLVTFAVGSALVVIAGLYVREARRTRARALVPQNTTFEETERNLVISWITVAVFAASVVAAIILFGSRYLDSKLHTWIGASPVAQGFWTSRVEAHEMGCDSAPCFALAQRLYGTNPITGVNEYKLYLTDGALILLSVVFCIAIGFLIAALVKPSARPPRYYP